jgi:hypothetical protein
MSRRASGVTPWRRVARIAMKYNVGYMGHSVEDNLAHLLKLYKNGKVKLTEREVGELREVAKELNFEIDNDRRK